VFGEDHARKGESATRKRNHFFRNSAVFKMSDSEDDYGSSGHSSSDDEDQGSNNAPIMSIFASYYGIEDPTTTTDQQSDKDSIDEVNFNADKYVRVSYQ
jgi:hypothetical protein